MRSLAVLVLILCAGALCACAGSPKPVVAPPPAASEVSPAVASTVDPVALNAAIDAGRRMTEPAYRLDVLCTDRNGKRAMRVYPSGTAVWDTTTQVVVDADVRLALLEEIRRADFATMADNYGGKRKKSEKKLGPHAALRVRCFVGLQIHGVSKTSIQQLDGEQSPRVEGLANALLDRIEPLVDDGITPRDLADGLQQVTVGALRPETFELRFVQLPPQKAETGVIYTIRDGMTSRQDYAPGRKIGDPVTEPVDSERLALLCTALRIGEVSRMPVNLRADQQVELTVRVLGHKRTVIARNFSRAPTAAQKAAQPRFEALLDHVRAMADGG